MTREKGIHSYLDLDSYRELTLLQEIRENHVHLMRTKRRIEKLHSFQLSQSFLDSKHGTGSSTDRTYNEVARKLGLPEEAEPETPA